jgi:hypothetical protein
MQDQVQVFLGRIHSGGEFPQRRNDSFLLGVGPMLLEINIAQRCLVAG